MALKIILIAIVGSLASCTVAPTVIRRPDGSMVASLGASILESTDSESGNIVMSDGTQISYTKTGKDQTKVVSDVIRAGFAYKTVVGLADAANVGEATRETAETRRVISDNGVKNVRTAADVKIKTFVPPEIP